MHRLYRRVVVCVTVLPLLVWLADLSIFHGGLGVSYAYYYFADWLIPHLGLQKNNVNLPIIVSLPVVVPALVGMVLLAVPSWAGAILLFLGEFLVWLYAYLGRYPFFAPVFYTMAAFGIGGSILLIASFWRRNDTAT